MPLSIPHDRPQSGDFALIERVQARLARELAHGAGNELLADPARTVAAIREEAGVISDSDLLRVLRALRGESVGAGILEPLLSIDGLTDVVVNGPREVWIDRGGGLERADISFAGEQAVRRLASRLAHASGNRLDDAQPFADGRIIRDDGTVIRVHAVLAPPSDSGTLLSLRVLRQARFSIDALVNSGTLDETAACRVSELVEARASMLIAGGTGSGKTTLMSALIAQCPSAERIICIEDTPELAPDHPHVVTLTTRRANVEGRGEITLSDLVRQSLRMRPDRIIVGEIRGAEIVDMLTAMNTGHDGGAATLHANSLAEVPARIEALGAMGGLNREETHAQLAAAIDVVLVMRRRVDGVRELYQIGEAARGEDGTVSFQPVWGPGSKASDRSDNRGHHAG